MTFPITMDHPKFTLILPTSKKNIEFRPFLEKERKILLMTLESGNDKDIQATVLTLVKACCLTTDVDVYKLSIIDLEYFFLHLRAKSIGELLNLNFVCENVTPQGRCGHTLNLQVNINDITVANLNPENKKIPLTGKIGVMMNYPNLIETDKSITDIEFLYDMVVSCIEYVYEDENIYYAREYKKEDLYFFVTNLTLDQFKKLEHFIINAPVLRKSLNHNCKKCGFIHTITLEGLQSFFA